MVELNCNGILIKEGAVSDEVTEIQNRLQKAGFYLTANDDGAKLKVDGKFKQYTKEEIMDFQKSVGINDSGEFNEETCKKLNEKIGIKETSKDTKKDSTKKANNKKVSGQRKNVVIIDPKKYNVHSPSEANLTIESLHFIIEAITEKDTLGKQTQWKQYELLNNRHRHYKAHSVLPSYELTFYLHFDQYKRVHNAFILMQNKEKCLVVSELLESGLYKASFHKTYDRKDLWKITMNLVSYD